MKPPLWSVSSHIIYHDHVSPHGGVSWTHRDQPRNGTIGEAVKDHLPDIGLNDLPLSRGLRGPIWFEGFPPRFSKRNQQNITQFWDAHLINIDMHMFVHWKVTGWELQGPFLGWKPRILQTTEP